MGFNKLQRLVVIAILGSIVIGGITIIMVKGYISDIKERLNGDK